MSHEPEHVTSFLDAHRHAKTMGTKRLPAPLKLADHSQREHLQNFCENWVYIKFQHQSPVVELSFEETCVYLVLLKGVRTATGYLLM